MTGRKRKGNQVIKTYGELDATQIDVLRELGNIGAGNAATSLSVMLDEGVGISVPQVKILDYDGVVRVVGDPEDLGVAIMIQFGGDVRGIVLFVLNHEDAMSIGDLLVGEAYHPEEGCEEPDLMAEMKLSTIKEIGNILGCSYLGSIGTMTGLTFEVSVPYVAIDMVGAILSAPLLLFSMDNSKILLVEESFSTESHSIRSHVILFADITSLNTILNKLGLDV